MVKNVWLDCDPGHDDAIALLLALELPEIRLLGISTVNGNSSLENTTRNAAALLTMYRAPKDIELHRGANQPSGAVEYDEGAAETIHGASGMDGVELLPSHDNPTVQHHYSKSPSGSNTASSAMAKAIRQAKAETGEKTWVVVTGPCTNAAALIAEEEDLVRDSVAGWVVMGGAFGIPQWTPVAEFNIHTDPAGLQAILRPFPFPPVVLAPLNITHTAIFTEAIQKRLLHPDGTGLDGDAWKSKGKSDVRWMLSTLVTFFAKTYREVFGFMDGPPIHDALCVSWLANPEFFKGKWATLEVGAVTEGPEGRGETRPVKGTEWQELSFEDGLKEGKGGNCYSLMELDTDGFWNSFLRCVGSVEQKILAQPL